MGLGDFLGGLFGTNNSYHADPRVNGYQVNQGGYAGASQQAILAAQQNQGQQSNYINMLQGQAAGTGAPSIAQMLLQQQTERNAQNSASAIASQRGMNPGLAAKLALDQAAAGNQQSAGQAAILRSQEQLQAQGLLGQALGQQGAQANQLAGTTGGLDMQGQGLAGQIAGQNAQLALGADQINSGVAQQNASQNAGLVGGLLGGIGSATAFHGTSGGGPGGAATGAGGGSFIGQGPSGLIMAQGGVVPGRAQVAGNSPQNDTVPARLSPGEVVLPRSVADDPERAAAFVRAIQRKSAADSAPQGYGAVLAKQRDLDKRLKALEGKR